MLWIKKCLLLKNRNVFGSACLWVKPSSRRNIQLPGLGFVASFPLPDVMYQAGDVPSLDFFGFFMKIFCNFMFLIGLNLFWRIFRADLGFFMTWDCFCDMTCFVIFWFFWGKWRRRFVSRAVFRHFWKPLLIIFEYFDKRYNYLDKRYYWNLDIFNELICMIFLIWYFDIRYLF